jgi:N-acyl-D-amino-acid deacylase
VGTQIAHGPVRAYVMGAGGARNEPANAEEIEAMSSLVRDALEAGALGFSSSRVMVHRSMDGQQVPGTFADETELFGIARALRDSGSGVFQLAPAGVDGEDPSRVIGEVDWMRRLSNEMGIPITFSMLEVYAQPDLWRNVMDESTAALASGALRR